MNKNIYITESQFKKYLKEELSVAKEVVDMSDEIYKQIIKRYENYEIDFAFQTYYNLNVDVKIFQFKNNKELSNYLDNGGFKNLFCKYSPLENILFIREIEVNGDLNLSSLKNNISHEVEHFIQSYKKGKPLTAKNYKLITNYMSDDNDIIVSFVCKLLYFTTKFELDGYINGFYSDLKTCDLGRDKLVDIINKSECGLLLQNFKDWHNSLEKWTKTPVINNGRIKLYNIGILKYDNINDMKSYLIKRLNKAYLYLLKKIGKVYSLAKKEYDNNIKDKISENEMEFKLLIHSPIGQQKNKMNDDEAISGMEKYLKYE